MSVTPVPKHNTYCERINICVHNTVKFWFVFFLDLNTEVRKTLNKKQLRFHCNMYFWDRVSNATERISTVIRVIYGSKANTNWQKINFLYNYTILTSLIEVHEKA